MSDMTLEPMDSLSALERMLPLLKDGGKVLQVIKMSKKLDRRPVLDRMEELGIDILNVLESHKQEIYVVGQKKGVNETME
jgi:23S rRNA (cytidine1920-2'-O)/16S rRNA (cytidine1409-2'-O)-methyltransferase